jgi:hypothetical protein
MHSPTVPINVRFTLKSRHYPAPLECPLCAKSGHRSPKMDAMSGQQPIVLRQRLLRLFGKCAEGEKQHNYRT